MTRDGGHAGALRSFALSAVLAAALAASSAFAQAPLEANGLKIGDGRLHPYINLIGRYDSAAGFFAGSNRLGPEIILHAQPGLRFNLDSSAVLFNFNGNAEYVWYTGLLSPASTAASRFQTNVGLDTAFNREGAVEVQLGNTLNRSDRTQTASVGIGVVSLFNNAYLRFPIHPGGRALEFTPRVDWAVEFFDPLLPGNVPGCTTGDITCDPQQLFKMNYSNVTPGLGARWKFLPKTALLFDTSLGIRTYWNDTAGAINTNQNALLFNVRAGLAGLITSKLSVTATIGYGGDFAGLQRNGFSSVIAQAELAWLPREGASLRVGYLRNANAAPVFGTIGDDRAYIDGRFTFFTRLTVGASFAFDYLTFYRPANVATFSRNDVMLTALALLEYRFTSWFFVAANFGYTQRIASTGTSAAVNFQRIEPMLRLTFQY